MRKLRLYLGQMGDDYVEADMSEETFRKLVECGRVNFDDGGIVFAELFWRYPHPETEEQGEYT